MNREEIFYLIPYLLSLALSLGVFGYTWRYRHVRGARAYAWFVGGQTLTILGFIFELVSPSLQSKLLWDKFQWITLSLFVFPAFLIFAIQFSESKVRSPRLVWGFWLFPPISFLLLLLTDGLHQLLYPNPHLSIDYPFPELQYDFTFVVYVYILLYIYGVNLYGIGLLIRRAFQPHNFHRSQYLTIALGFFIPLGFSLFSLTGIRITPQRDITPFSLALGNLIVAWGVFRYRVFDIVPIARDRIVETMSDPVIVLDITNRIVDINKAALQLIEKHGREVIGRPASSMFSQWPAIVALLENTEEQHSEVATQAGSEPLFIDTRLSPMFNEQDDLVGRILVMRDITRHKILEDRYRRLSEELEERVRERTAELAEAYDTTLEGWAKALELRDKETEGHSRRVTDTTLVVARAMGFNGDELVAIRHGAALHDIGKMAIPDDILRKPGPLTEAEREIVMQHPRVAYELLVRIPHLKQALEIPYAHHEKWDGTGYPRGLRGEEIPLPARIFAIVDVFDALSSNRPYRPAWLKEQVVDYLLNESGKHFDPKVVSTFLCLLEANQI